MRSVRALALAGVALAAGVPAAAAHDLFIKLTSYFLRPGAGVRVPILNGTFTSSDNAVARDRIADLALVSPAGRTTLDTMALDAARDTTFLELRAGGPGTYVLGLSTRPNRIALSGEEFAGYLAEEALTDVIAARKAAGLAADSARERYSKHVKAVFQVGAERTDGHATLLGFPAEIVPLDNPYRLRRGAALRVRCLVDGRPRANLPVLAGGRGPDGSRLRRRELRTDADGVVSLPLDARGKWYVKFIHMTRVNDPDVDYESKWATLTFEVR
ncbi:MAG TPA: DUF4198 domain-containing protein [Gemmatimonadales bacterium]|nr:DUF4198 domain-containing protein [Gemmatimonadales bacterium]